MNKLLLPLFFCLHGALMGAPLYFSSPACTLTQHCSLTSDGPKIPKEVLYAFKQKFATITNAKWKIGKDGSYVAHFESGGKKSWASFSGSGKWIESGTQVPASALTKEVKDALYGKYGENTKVLSSIKINTASGLLRYELKFKPAKGKTKIATFDDKGVEMERF